MDRSDVTQIVLEAYDSRWRGDRDGTLACFHPNVKITSLGDPGTVPFAGRYQGLDGLKTYLDRLDAGTRAVVPTLEDLIVDGARAVVRWVMPVENGQPVEGTALRFIDIVSLDRDLIVAVDQYHDTAAAAVLFGARAAASSRG